MASRLFTLQGNFPQRSMNVLKLHFANVTQSQAREIQIKTEYLLAHDWMSQ